MAHPDPPIDEEYMDYISINFEDSLDLEEMNVDFVHLVGLLIVDQESSQIIVNIKVFRAKDSVYSIEVGDEKMARRILEGNPWFIKGGPFTVKLWPMYQSLEEIEANQAIFWIQVHGIPKNLCTIKNARVLGSKLGLLKIEDPVVTGFRGFLQVQVDLDATKPFLTNYTKPCLVKGDRTS